MSAKFETTIWSRESGRRMFCFGQVLIDHNIDAQYQRFTLDDGQML